MSIRTHGSGAGARALLLLALLAGCDNGASQEPVATEPPAVEEANAAAPAEPTDAAAPEPVPDHAVPPAPAPDSTAATDPTAPPPPDPSMPVANDPDQASGASSAESQLVPQRAPGSELSAAQRAARRRAGEFGGGTATERAPDPATAPAAPVADAAARRAMRREHMRAVAIRLRPPALLAGTEPGAGQPQVVMSLQAGNVGITNLDAALPVNFAMKSELSEWRSESLAPRLSQEYGCSIGNSDCLFWMRTGTKPAVFYKIRSPDRYAIFWNTEQGLWDLRRVERDD